MFKNFHKFKDIDEAISYGKRHFSSRLKDFQKGEKYQDCFSEEYILEDEIKKQFEMYIDFYCYCGGSFGLAINELCRYGQTNYDFNIEQLRRMIKVMDEEIKKHYINEDIVGYRLLNYKDLLCSTARNVISKGDIIIHKGFMGVGLVQKELVNLYSSNYDTLIQCYIPKTCNGIYLDFISVREKEQEVLLNTDKRLKVLSNKYNYFKRRRFIKCIVLPDN